MRSLPVFAVLLALALLIALPIAGVASISYQGQLTDGLGNPVADSTYSIMFTIYDRPVGGTELWSSGFQVVPTTAGLFTFELGSSVALPPGLFATDSSVWLGITVSPDAEMSPRTEITPAPTATVSHSVHGDIETSRGQMVLVDGVSGPLDSSIVILNNIRAFEHRGHVTVLKIAAGGSDTTNLIDLDGNPQNPAVVVGDGSPTDSSVIVTTESRTADFHGHVTVLKIAAGGSDTTNLIDLVGSPETPAIVVGDGSPEDSSVVVTTESRTADFHGHVTVLKIAAGGSDTTNLIDLVGSPETPAIVVGDGSPDDSSVVVTTESRTADFHGHVTVLKIAAGGSDTTNLVDLVGDPQSPAVVVGDGSPSDSSFVVTTGVSAVDHRGHVTVLKIANGGNDTTEFVSISGDNNGSSIHMDGGAAGGSISLTAGGAAGSGFIGVNTTTPAHEVDVVGTICATGGLCQKSDRRLKSDITPFDNALNLLLSLNPVSYNWKYDEYPARQMPKERQIGFIAQEVKEVLPSLVSEGADGMLALDYAHLTPVLVGAVQEQQAKIETLEAELAEMKNLVQQLVAQKNAPGGDQYGAK